MHDLVHDLACSILGFTKVNDNASDGIYQARYIYWTSEGDESSHISRDQTKWLRTFFYKGDISDFMFSAFKSLHVLILLGPLGELPDSIRELIHLRFFNISHTSVKILPDSIGELYHLQTFKATDCCLEKLPSTFKYLFNLRHLNVSDDTELPPHLGMLTSLQTLPYFKLRDVEGHRIAKFASLKNLKESLKIYNLEKVQGEDESNKACLFKKSDIIRLVLQWDGRGEGEINDESVLRGLHPHPNLKFLEIVGYKGKSFPSWTLKIEGLNNLMEIKLESCTECEEIPTLGHLPRLRSLYLSNLDNVKSISSSFYSIDDCISNNVFPALERLELFWMSNLLDWVEVETPSSAEVKVFPCLQYLKIEKCNQLKSAPSIFPCLKTLEIDGMDSDVPLANICGIKLTSLVKLEINGVGEMECLPGCLFKNNQNLSKLEIRNCRELRELPDGLQALNSLKKLTILHCDNLALIPFSSGLKSQGLTALCRLLIVSDTETNFPCEMLESCASSLEELELRTTVTNMPMVIEHMHKMHCLTVLNMEDIPKFIISSPTELGSLHSLKSFSFRPDESWDSVSFNKAVGAILRLGSRSLIEINLSGMKDWECLPDQLQHLTVVVELTQVDFGIEKLPKWFGNLSSLEALFLYDFEKLKLQPSVEVMRRLTNLSYEYLINAFLFK